MFPWVYTGKKIDFNSFDEISSLGTNLGSIKKSHEYVVCYRKNSFMIKLLKSNDKITMDRITKNGNKISQLKFPKGLHNENIKLNKKFESTIGGTSEPIKIINEEGMVFKNGILQNDVILETCYSVKGFLLKFFNGEDTYDKREWENFRCNFFKDRASKNF